jgi:hypothetical protein
MVAMMKMRCIALSWLECRKAAPSLLDNARPAKNENEI